MLALVLFRGAETRGTPPSAVLEIFRREFDGAVAEGGLFLLTMHPHIIGHRSRMAILEELVRPAADRAARAG